jgi:hypothetical protein
MVDIPQKPAQNKAAEKLNNKKNEPKGPLVTQ